MKDADIRNKDLEYRTKVAQLKLQYIGPLLNEGLNTYSSARQYCIHAVENPIKWPDGTEKNIHYKTLLKWYYDYKKGGFEGLMPKGRSDKGETRKISDEAIEEIHRIRSEFPRMNATQMYGYLIENDIIGPISVSTLQRYIKHNGLKIGQSAPEVKDRRKFEVPSFGEMWQCDTMHVGYITVGGEKKKVYLAQIIDDHTRMIVGGKMIFSDSAVNFQKIFKSAIELYGIPVKLYVDNGGPYANEQLQLICGSLGVVLINCKVRDPQAKGKVERLNLTVSMQLLDCISLGKIKSLDELNNLYTDFVKKYNHREHSAIKMTPYDSYMKGPNVAKDPESLEWLNTAFLNRVTRTVRNDNTISIFSNCFDVPTGYAKTKIEVRFIPDDANSVFMYTKEKKFDTKKDESDNPKNKGKKRKLEKDGKGTLTKLVLTDPKKNARTKRTPPPGTSDTPEEPTSQAEQTVESNKKALEINYEKLTEQQKKGKEDE